MLEKIQELEQKARFLEPDSKQRDGLRNKVIDHSEAFLESLKEEPAYLVTDDKGKALWEHPVGEEGAALADLLQLVHEQVDRPGLHPASGGHLAYIPGGGLFVSALGDYLADVGNHYAGVFYASPGAVRMENVLIRWMCDLVGYPDSAAGNLTSGGSIANLSGIVAARDAKGISSRKVAESVIYLTEQVHHCVTKAIRIGGLGEAQIRYVAIDEHFRMDPNSLAQQVKADKEAGLIPWLVVVSAGTTDTGAVDPIARIADITEREDIWLHVDAAYGGFFILCEDGKKLLKGIERSDSVVMDPHKSLFLPYGSGALLIKDREHLLKSQHYQANYLLDAKNDQEELSPADLSPELTKPFRGLRLWLPLKYHGLSVFRAAIEEKLWLARWFYENLELEIPGMERGPYPDLSVVLYRYLPQSGEANQFNLDLIEAIRQDGRVFLSSTRINGEVYLRLAVLSFRTHLDTIELTFQALKDCIQRIEKSY